MPALLLLLLLTQQGCSVAIVYQHSPKRRDSDDIDPLIESYLNPQSLHRVDSDPLFAHYFEKRDKGNNDDGGCVGGEYRAKGSGYGDSHGYSYDGDSYGGSHSHDGGRGGHNDDDDGSDGD